MRRGSKFSLAAALFGWPSAPGNAEPHQLAPDSWLAQFREQHATADPAVLSGLFTACPAGRNWVLEAAPKVTITLDTTAAQTPAQWQRRISVLAGALSARGSTGVCLRIECDDGKGSAVAAYVLPGLLPGLSGSITGLVMHNSATTHATVSLMHAAVSAFAPHLTTLSLDPCPCALPPPDLLPQLRSLSLSTAELGADDSDTDSDADIEAEIVQSVAPYTAQLTTLQFTMGFDHALFPWPELTPATPSHTLTSLSIDFMVDDPLLTLIIDSFPALQSLSAAGLRLDEDYSHKVWAVGQLTLTDGQGEPGEWGDCESQLCQLPRCQEGAVMTVCIEDVDLAGHKTGLSAQVLERLSEWRFDCDRLFLMPDRALSTSAHPATLRRTVSQLCDGLQTTGDVALWTREWQWDADMLRGYMQAFPALAERGVVSHDVDNRAPLTDALLGIVLEAGKQISGLGFESLALASDTHANTPWLWDQLGISSLDIADLCKLPDPAGAGAPRKVWCHELVLSDILLQADMDALTQRLAHVLLTMPSEEGLVRLQCPKDPTQQAAALESQLSVLRAVRLDRDEDDQPLRVDVSTWPVNKGLKKALKGLPSWAVAKYK